MKHCDDYIDDPDQPDCLRDYLDFNRDPATEQFRRIQEGEPEPSLYARHNGVPVRVVMASRFGDVGITTDLTREKGYSDRVPVEDLTDFSAGPHG